MQYISRKADYKWLKVTSYAFNDQELIPIKYTCDGQNISPPLDIERIPPETKCLVIVVDDPDAPAGTWVHWLIWNIPLTHHIKENESHGMQGTNSFEKKVYCGPCPPDGNGTHRYFFKVYALDCILDLYITSKKHNLEKAMAGHILAFGELVGLYKRQ